MVELMVFSVFEEAAGLSPQPVNKRAQTKTREQVVMRISKYLPLILMVLILLMIQAEESFAEVSSFDKIAEKFQDVGTEYITKLKDYAFGIFKIFILIDVGIFGLRAALNRSEISEIISQFLMMLVFATFCVVAIKYYPDWTGFLLDKSRTIAGAVNGGHVEFTPIDTGWEILTRIIDATPSLFVTAGSAIKALCLFLLGGIIMVCFCLMGASMLVVLCESYIAMSAAVLLLGFGGSSMVKDYAINTMRYAVSVAFKLFVIRLLMGVGMELINELSTFEKVTFENLFPILISAIVFLVLIRALPETVAGIINGSHTGSGVGLGSAVRGIATVAAGTASAGVGAVAGAASVAQTVSRAQKIASINGHGGGGTFGNLANAFSAARQQTGGQGGLKATLGQMNRNISDMYHTQRAMKDPNFEPNPYMSPLSRPANPQNSSNQGSGPGSGATDNSSSSTGSANPQPQNSSNQGSGSGATDNSSASADSANPQSSSNQGSGSGATDNSSASASSGPGSHGQVYNPYMSPLSNSQNSSKRSDSESETSSNRRPGPAKSQDSSNRKPGSSTGGTDNSSAGTGSANSQNSSKRSVTERRVENLTTNTSGKIGSRRKNRIVE